MAALLLVIAYLIGSVPTAWLLVRSLHQTDIREHGSGNVGATNAKRLLGWPGFFFVFAVDAAKGALAVSLPMWLPGLPEGVPDFHPTWLGVAAVAGHCLPLWLRFRGGKGLATMIGAFALHLPWAMGLLVLLWLGLFWRTRTSSIGTLAGLAAAGISVLGWGSLAVQAPFFVTCGLVIFQHRDNIERLKTGREPTA